MICGSHCIFVLNIIIMPKKVLSASIAITVDKCLFKVEYEQRHEISREFICQETINDSSSF